MSQTTTLDGTLIRDADGTWRWCDDRPEPRVTDLTISAHYNYRCRTYGCGTTTYVEVPLKAARREADLAWVWEGVTAGRYQQAGSGDHTGPLVIDADGSAKRMRIEPGEDPLHGNEPIVHTRAIPKVALVPVDEWDARPPVGASWDCAYEDDILERAYSLGWRPLKTYRSRGPRGLEFAP